MNSHPTEAGKGADLIRHYAEVRSRLVNGPPPPPAMPRRFIRVRPQPHRPDYVPPAPKLPYVVITEASQQRVRDILTIAQETRVEPIDLGHWREIAEQVCAKYAITRSELMSNRRAPNLVAARHEAMYRMSKETSMSLPAIGCRLGRDHTTVIYGIRKHASKLGAGL